MAQSKHITTPARRQGNAVSGQPINLSDLFRDPVIAAAFRRGEGDSSAFAIPAAPRPVAPQGAEMAHEAA